MNVHHVDWLSEDIVLQLGPIGQRERENDWYSAEAFMQCCYMWFIGKSIALVFWV